MNLIIVTQLEEKWYTCMIHVIITERREGWMGMLRIEVIGNKINTNNAAVQKSHCCDACVSVYDKNN